MVDVENNRSCLIVVFNHRYDNNLNRIKNLYSGRFSDIFVLMPFYEGSQPEGIYVIPVYGSSYCFQGYIAQAAKYIFDINPQGYDYYCVIADDLLINPAINQHNLASFLSLKENSSYIKKLCYINDSSGITPKRLNSWIVSPFIEFNGTEYTNEIPSCEEAFKICEKKYGRVDKSMSLKWILQRIGNGRPVGVPKRFVEIILLLIKNKGLRLPYPLFKIYSDFIVINGKDFKEVSRMFGVFAAMGLFAEVAIPTTMAICCKEIVTESQCDKKGIELWAKSDKEKFQEEYSFDLQKLIDNWDKETIYYHPVKLSKWK